MQLIRTTLRLRSDLKRAAELLAFEQHTTLQEVLNRALDAELKKESRSKVRKIKFGKHSLGVALDNLKREDYYSED